MGGERFLRAGLAGAAAIAAGLLAWGAVVLPRAPRIGAAVEERLAESGVAQPVTAVLLNFRGHDTLLEVAVLLLAAAGAAMQLATALVGWGVALFAAGYEPHGDLERAPGRFWPPFLMLWAGLNALCLSADVFNLYVTLELIALAAIVLVTLEGKAAAVTAAMRYLLVAQVGSLCYFVGVGFLYGFGTLDLGQLGAAVRPGVPATLAAFMLFTAGQAPGLAAALLLFGLGNKLRLLPLHLALAPAYAAMPAAVTAAFAGPVLNAAVYGLLRFLPLGGEALPGLAGAMVVLGLATAFTGGLLARCRTTRRRCSATPRSARWGS